MKIIIVICVILTIIACEKNIDSTSENKYIGNRYSHWSNYSSNYGLQKGDTIYADTFIVQLIGDDSIYFEDKKSISKFQKNKIGIYNAINSNVHYGKEYRLVKDSLIYYEWSNSGAGSSYNRSLITFVGIKNN